MSLPRDPDRDLSLERLGDRDSRPPPPLNDSALISRTLGPQSINRDFRTTYEALIDAVFTAPGAVEWLTALRRTVAAMLASKSEAARPPPQLSTDAIRQAEPGEGRSQPTP